MPDRHLPVRPHLDQLRHQAKDLLRAMHARDAEALEDLSRFHPDRIAPEQAKLADAQLVLARSYGAPSWQRLSQACDLIDAIWRDDLKQVRTLVMGNRKLLFEPATVIENDWGPPMSYAANLGRDRIIRMLHDLGATDHQKALGRAALQGQVGTGVMLHELMGRPPLPDGALAGPAYTLSESGTRFALGVGAPVVDDRGRRLAPVDVVLETDSRKPAEKHAILELYVSHGLALPDTPTMALHRGRLDLLEAHLQRDPALVHRTFSHEEIYPPDLGCHDEVLATTGTPLTGTTLLHMCVDYDEYEIAQWLIAHGAKVDTPARVGADGFGGHTALFGAVVSQPNFWINYQHREPQARFAQLLLDHGADPNARASIRKQLHPGYDDPRVHEYRDVTPLEYGARFSHRLFVNERAMRLIYLNGGEPPELWAAGRAPESELRQPIEIFGRRFEAVRTSDGWSIHYPTFEGKRGAVLDVPIASDVATPRELRDYLADVCHEWATPQHASVRWLDR